MTFNYMIYMSFTRKGYLSIILSAVHRESFRLTELLKLLPKRWRFTGFIVSSFKCSGVSSKMTLRSIGDLEVFCSHLMSLPAKLYYPRVNGLRVTRYAFHWFTWGGYPRMGYKYGFIHFNNRLHTLLRFV